MRTRNATDLDPLMCCIAEDYPFKEDDQVRSHLTTEEKLAASIKHISGEISALTGIITEEFKDYGHGLPLDIEQIQQINVSIFMESLRLAGLLGMNGEDVFRLASQNLRQ